MNRDAYMTHNLAPSYHLAQGSCVRATTAEEGNLGKPALESFSSFTGRTIPGLQGRVTT